MSLLIVGLSISAVAAARRVRTVSADGRPGAGVYVADHVNVARTT